MYTRIASTYTKIAVERPRHSPRKVRQAWANRQRLEAEKEVLQTGVGFCGYGGAVPGKGCADAAKKGPCRRGGV